jgi:hypothetical protein
MTHETGAQEQSLGSGLLDIPKKQVVCRRLPADSREPRATFSYEFEIGNNPMEDSRTIHVSYDRQGGVILLIEINSRSGGGPPTAIGENIAVGFLPDGSAKGVRSHLEYTVSDPPRPRGEPRHESLTAADIEKARRLASWLWEKRCDESRGT